MFFYSVVHSISKTSFVSLTYSRHWDCKDAQIIMPAHSQEAHSLKDLFLLKGMKTSVKEKGLAHLAIFQSPLQPEEYFINLVSIYAWV